MQTKICATIVLLGVSCGILFSQNRNTQKLDSFLNRLYEKNKAMGSLTISNNGKVIYTKATGYSFISSSEKISATEKTKYRIGSISKMFTATMIFQLIEEGKLSLTTTLDQYFPSLPNATKITIGNLLNHRSGLHNFTDSPEYKDWMTQPKTEDEMLAIIAKGSIDFQPNEKTAYSNSNYVVLGYIVEKIYKQPYSKILTTKITSKIGLSNTYYGMKADIKKNESLSYRYGNNWEQAPETDMSIPGGAGALVSTPTDLAKFIESLFALKLVSNASLTQMKTITDGMGMGMFQVPFYDKKAYGHNGGIDGFVSNLGYFPEDKLAVAYCSNGMAYSMNDILIGVLSIYFEKPYAIPSFSPAPTISLKTEELDKYLGIYSSEQMPLKITISKNNTILIAQATGQSSFPLQATEKDMFIFENAGIVMEFNAEKGELTLKQGGGNFLFTRGK